MTLYYKMQRILLQNATAVLITKCDKSLLQNATLITKCDVCYKLRQCIKLDHK